MKVYLTILPSLLFRRGALLFRGVGAKIASPMFKLNVKRSGIGIPAEQYAGMCIFSALFYSVIFFIIALFAATKFELKPEVPLSLGVGLVFGAFIFTSTIKLPKAIITRRVMAVEKDVIPVVRDMIVQINSGVPLFEIMVNISNGKYGAITTVFKKAVKDITAGKSQTKVLEEIAESTPSTLFRRTLWQVVNATKIGAPIVNVLEDSLENLYEEQAIQIQKYGSTLSGLAMFYLLIAVIAPAIFFTLAIVVSMFLKITTAYFTLLFFVMLLVVLFLQIFFLGVIRVRRSALI
jgi:pilus assembly protein TadC